MGAVSPLTERSEDDPPDGYLALRWTRAGVGGTLAALGALASHFPRPAVAALALYCALMSLWPMPSWASRLWLVGAIAFWFAQVTSVFVNTPFTWPLRFLFCAVILAPLSFVRISGDE